MIYALWIYLACMFVLGWQSYKKIHNYKDFVIAGANQGTLRISFSMLASIIGGSATFGMMSLLSQYGFPAFWWLGIGALFLYLQAVILSKGVRRLNAYSLPHVAKLAINEKASFFIALIVCLSWTGIVAAQFSALGQLVTVMVGAANQDLIIAIIAVLTILYTVLGGQLSIIRTDVYQFFILFLAVTCTFILLYGTNFSPANIVSDTEQSLGFLKFSDITHLLASQFELFNQRFTGFNFGYLCLVVGLAYFVGPDIFARNLSARDEHIAQKATLIAATLLIIFALMMCFIGLWSMNTVTLTESAVTSSPQQNPLITLINAYLPVPLAMLLTFGLLSALISSADTCLMSAASILGNDILKTHNIKHIRLFICILGFSALGLALIKGNIIGLLLGAYSVYVPGVVLPLAFAVYFYQKREININILLFGMVIGSTLGILSTLFSNQSLAVIGILCSGIMGICALLRPCKKNKRLGA